MTTSRTLQAPERKDRGRNVALRVRVPAKAMLFGEYGVLRGGPALVATLPELKLNLCVRARSAVDAEGLKWPQVSFRSDFLGSPCVLGQAFFSDETHEQEFNRLLESRGEKWRLVLRAIVALKSVLRDQGWGSVDFEVLESFSPDLGLGSSSALLVALYRACQALKHDNVQEGGFGVEIAQLGPEEWQGLISLLRAAQGPGSGYDLAVQFLASQCSLRDQVFPVQGRTLWVFRPANSSETAPEAVSVEAPWFWQQCGFLIPSGVLASTAEVLNHVSSKQEPLWLEHGEIASLAILRVVDRSHWRQAASGQPHPLADLFLRSRTTADAQGISAHIRSGWLEDWGVQHYKTMGAGHGDCVWAIFPQSTEERVRRALGSTDFLLQKNSLGKLRRILAGSQGMEGCV